MIRRLEGEAHDPRISRGSSTDRLADLIRFDSEPPMFKALLVRHPTLRHDLLLIEDGGPKSADAARLVGSAKGARFY